MPYRTAPPKESEPSKEGLGSKFWAQSNGFSEVRAALAADDQIVSGLKRLLHQWYKVTRNKYPKEHHVILHDLNQAILGRGEYIRVSGKSKLFLGVLMATADIEGMLRVIPELFDVSKATKQEMVARTKESAIRWIEEDPQVRKVLDAAFAANVGKLDKYLLAQYPGVDPKDVVEGVYFRAVAQYDMKTFTSPTLARDLYLYLFD